MTLKLKGEGTLSLAEKEPLVRIGLFLLQCKKTGCRMLGLSEALRMEVILFVLCSLNLSFLCSNCRHVQTSIQV